MALGKPPINSPADTIAVKGWFTDVYKELNSGILVPGGGVITAPSYSSRRNLLVNGDFMINQRQSSFIAGTPTWTLDRWGFAQTVGVFFVNPNSPKSFANSLVGFNEMVDFDCTTGNATASTLSFGQAVESNKIVEITNLPVTLSFWSYGGPAYSQGAWAQQTLNRETGSLLAIVRTGTGVNEGTLATYTGSTDIITIGATPLNSIWTYHQGTGIIPTNAQELQVIFQSTKTTVPYPANSFFGITGVQLELGTRPTAFDKIPFSQSLAECQRFYQKSFVYSQAPIQNSGTYAGSFGAECIISGVVNLPVFAQYKVPMAKIPLITFYNPVAANANWRNTARNLDSGGGFLANPGDSGGTFVCSQIAGDAAGNTLAVHYTLEADI